MATGAIHGPLQRVEPKPFTTARTSSIRPEVRRWYDLPTRPVRLHSDTSRRGTRDGADGGR